jgi:integrase/recombinase XerD
LADLPIFSIGVTAVISDLSLLPLPPENGPALERAETKFEETLQSLVTRQLSPHSRKAYRQDATQFVNWMGEQSLTLTTLDPSHIWEYRRYLSDKFALNSAARKLIVARKLLEEALARGLLTYNPAQGVEGYKAEGEQETTHTVLTEDQALQLLRAIDTTTRQGKRDFAIIMLLLRTGMRRSECAALRLGDLLTEQGHHVAFVRHAKGNKRRKIKIPVDVKRVLDEYLEAIDEVVERLEPEAPLFVQFRRGDHPQVKSISSQVIERLVTHYVRKSGLLVKLTPHGLRATFVTLTLEKGAKLQQVQYAVGHADPRTTERYQKRKLNLDHNAVDYLYLSLSKPENETEPLSE